MSFDELVEEIKEEEPTLQQVSISKIPLQINIEVGRINISLEELQKIRPGHKIPLSFTPKLVQLTIGNKVIGQGEIIEIGEEIGIKIVQINH